jgi:hypothetical protein
METVYIETQPTSQKNVGLLKATLSNFDFMGPLRGPCLWVEMLNPSGVPFDGQYVRIDGDDWQDWPCNQTNEEDYKYLSNVILKKVGLDWKHYLKFVNSPNFNVFTGSANYSFSCSVDMYPSGEASYQWNKDSVPIEGANSNIYTISNAQITDTGNYSVAVSNSEFSITGYTFFATGDLAF